MRQQAVEAEIDAEDAEDKEPGDEQHDAGPTEEPGKDSQRREQMDDDESVDVVFLQLHGTLLLEHAACARTNSTAGAQGSHVAPNRDDSA